MATDRRGIGGIRDEGRTVAWIEMHWGYDTGAFLRRLSFRVDGRRVARVRRGRPARVEVPAGIHVVQARMDWLRSAPLELDLAADATVSVTGGFTERALTATGFLLSPGTALELQVTAPRT
jgi:hypothetical protein